MNHVVSFVIGLIIGIVVTQIILWVVTFILILRRERIVRTVEKIEKNMEYRRKEPVAIIRSTTDAERAMEALKLANISRGGIPDSEMPR